MLADLDGYGVLPAVDDRPWQDWPDGPTASVLLRAPDGSGMGVFIHLDQPRARQVAHLADQVQEWAVEELCRVGLPTVWPHCPDHPDRHPMAAAVEAEEAVWLCPASRRRVGSIGELNGP